MTSDPQDRSELPEGVADAEPAGGWDPVDDGETRERADAASGTLVEGAEIQQGMDPDLVTDEQAERAEN